MLKKMRELEKKQQKELSGALKVPTSKAKRKKLDTFLKKQRVALAKARKKKPRSI